MCCNCDEDKLIRKLNTYQGRMLVGFEYFLIIMSYIQNVRYSVPIIVKYTW